MRLTWRKEEISQIDVSRSMTTKVGDGDYFGGVVVGRIAFSTGIVISWLVSLAAPPAEMKAPATGGSFEERYKSSIRAVLNEAGGQNRMTNVHKVGDEDLVAVKAASPESIQKPTMIASRYMPKMDRGMGMFVSWIEDHPSLREVTVRNPETKQEIKITIPQERLDEAARSGERFTFVYGWFFNLPPGFVSGTTQALEISAPEQKTPATCYPSVFVEQETTAPATRP